ncbi:methyltransferase [Syntrophobotulus glycolicus DSM 8271]|uniref:Methyltransferase n=1 Tax=Syntrophobotulus glycolicus (strain DSM 8271 / FlGlyR) TaxID=645991 RepID=F0SUF8_SYNGF|nr:16S rRNA (guanine(966)-N(2))-methyltransferase RsmD [Syntrophobotulus glycolicus]ADY56608.1 methyltransferase [Syntrophobotulus glycolicus DSM 8271]
MRIIAGDFKGRKLKAVPGMTTRPTSDKVKGAVFNILGTKVMEAKVLDLFAGTGNLGLEALSRGAQKVVLVEKDPMAWNIIKDNICFLENEKRLFSYKSDSFRFLQQHRGESYNLIFLDPPYHRDLAERAIEALHFGAYLEPAGVIVVETASDEVFDNLPEMLEVRIEREYGDTKVWFIQGKNTGRV